MTRNELYAALDATPVYHTLVVKQLPLQFSDGEKTHHAAFYYNRRQIRAGRKAKMHKVEAGWLFVRTA